MASSRIVYDPTKVFGRKIAAVAQFGTQYRQLLEELSRQMEAYVDDNTSLAADAGCTNATTAADLRTRCFNAAAEMTGNFVSQVNAGAHGPSRDLLDFIG